MIAYGCGRGRINRNIQEPYDPNNVKPTRYGRNRREAKGGAKAAPPIPVMVTDLETGEAKRYPSASDAARAMGCNLSAVSGRLSGSIKKPIIRGRYVVARVEEGQ